MSNTDEEMTLAPPALPSDYTALTAPLPLLGENDARWHVPARKTYPGGEEVEGVLIYEDKRALAFLVPEEAMSELAHLLAWAPYYLPLCEDTYAADLQRVIETALWELAADSTASTMQILRGVTVFISCSSDRETLQGLADAIEDHQGGVIRFYGSSNKLQSGFLIVESHEISSLLQWLREQPEVTDFVIDDPAKRARYRRASRIAAGPDDQAQPESAASAKEQGGSVYRQARSRAQRTVSRSRSHQKGQEPAQDEVGNSDQEGGGEVCPH